MQYNVTQQNCHRATFQNEFWDKETPGLYVDITSGEPMFSSKDKSFLPRLACFRKTH